MLSDVMLRVCYVIRRAAADGGGSEEAAALGPRPQRVCYQTLCYVVLSDGQLLTAEVRRRPQLWDPGHREYVIRRYVMLCYQTGSC